VESIFDRAGHGWRYGACELHAGCLSPHTHTYIHTHTHTHSEYVTLIAFPPQQRLHDFPPQQRLHDPASMLHYTHTACIVLYVKQHVCPRYSGTLHLIWNSSVTRFVYSSHTCRYSVVFKPKPTIFILHFSLTELPLSH